MSYPHPEVEDAPARVGFQPQAELSTVKRRVEKLLQQKKLTQQWLYDTVGMTKTGWREMWKRKSVKVTVMQDIAAALRVNMADLLAADAPDQLPTASEPQAGYQAKPRYLEERVADLEKELAELRNLVKRK